MNALNSNGEKLRLAALKQFKILDTLPEQEFDEITLLASQICETPIAAISLIDEGRQWFKSQIGLAVNETPRDCAFCDFAIGGDDVFVVNDARQDRRFSANPSVVNDPQIRFYAGAPLITNDGHKIGTLCVIDQTPRRLSKSQKRALSALARTVMNMIEARNPKDLTILPKNKNLGSIFSRTEESLKSGFYFNRYLKPLVSGYKSNKFNCLGSSIAEFCNGYSLSS